MQTWRPVFSSKLFSSLSCPSKAAGLGFLVGLALFVSLAAFFRGPASLLQHLGSNLRTHPQCNHETTTHRPPQIRASASKNEDCQDSRLKLLLSIWDDFVNNETSPSHWFPRPPYWQNCSEKITQYQLLDSRNIDGSLPSWSLWNGNLRDLEEDATRNRYDHVNLTDPRTSPRPPWVKGGDADNFPLTRRVQQDLWLHQHPKNCSDPQLRFLWSVWENGSGFGLGARIKTMLAFLAIAVRENRILVSDSFGRADHAGCAGAGRNQWECYFLPETSKECKARALELRSQQHAWEKGIITDNRNYSWQDMWTGKISGRWGSPWDYMQPTAEVHGKLVLHHMASDRRWWRAQALQYMMRFPSAYTCRLMNQARHQSFGAPAAELMLRSLPTSWPEVRNEANAKGEMERIVWGSRSPWIPRPMISMHVRLGDKAREMEMVGYSQYMELASRVRSSFPDATSIWLATEMEDIIKESSNYSDWNIYYTNIKRQTGTTSMFEYETSLGMEASTNNGFVNFLMASEADFFIGPLGSTWSLLIDCMRATSGKLMAGFLSVNADTFW